ncbi:atherin-like [Phalacrocorax carbo]|uniref:atherin-like n=1 Tax=Phalacrocorax carbo TaxID=9209 RepID=UPI00311A6DE0
MRSPPSAGQPRQAPHAATHPPRDRPAGGAPQPRRARPPPQGEGEEEAAAAGKGDPAGQRLQGPLPRAAHPALPLPEQRPTRAAGPGMEGGMEGGMVGGIPACLPGPSPHPPSHLTRRHPRSAPLRSAQGAARARCLPRLNAPGPQRLAPERTYVRRGRPRAPRPAPPRVSPAPWRCRRRHPAGTRRAGGPALTRPARQSANSAGLGTQRVPQRKPRGADKFGGCRTGKAIESRLVTSPQGAKAALLPQDARVLEEIWHL